jgi:ribosomal protein S18 acetylase RimI-like enzyme
MNKSGLLKINKTETFIEHDIEVDGVKVGNVELCPELHEISRLVIFEPYQNKGYGTMVVKDLIQQGYTSLWVRSDNKRAIHVYEKCGFAKGETHMFEMYFKKEIEE